MPKTYERTHPWITFQLDLRAAPYELWLLLGEARSKCEHLAGAPLEPETAQRLHLLYLAKGIQGTTAIEGNSLSEEQVSQAIQGELTLPPSKDYLRREVENILTACNMIKDHIIAGDPTPLTVETIRGFNRMVLAGLQVPEEVKPGEVRSHSVGVPGYRGAPAEDCEFLINRLCEWLGELDQHAPVAIRGVGMAMLRAVLAHLYIAWIHPFGDGNGRTARLLEFAILLQAGVPTPAAHLLSNHYNQTRSDYYRQLQHASQSGGDVMPFLSYAIRGFVDDLRLQIDEVKRQQLDVVWREFVYRSFRDGRSTAKHRCRDLVLALSQRREPVLISELTVLSSTLAAQYARKTTKTLARDINFLRSLDLVALVPGRRIEANKRLIAAFLPKTAPATTARRLAGSVRATTALPADESAGKNSGAAE